MPAKDVYSVGREEAAEGLGISTRTLDRWLKSGRIRHQIMQRIVYIHSGDFEKEKKKAARRAAHTPRVAAHESQNSSTTAQEGTMRNPVDTVYKELYETAAGELKEKQEKLEAAHFRVGQLETQLKNSVPLLEYKQTQEELQKAAAALEVENTKLAARITRERMQTWIAVGAAGLLAGVAIVFAILVLA